MDESGWIQVGFRDGYIGFLTDRSPELVKRPALQPRATVAGIPMGTVEIPYVEGRVVTIEW